MRIAMASARFPPFVGGTEMHVENVSKRLAARGHDVTVLTTVLDHDQAGETVVDGVRVVRLRAWPKRSDLYIAPSLHRRVRDGDHDVVHVQGYHTFVAPAALSGALRSSTPLVVTFHSGGHSSRIRRAIRPLHHRTLRRFLARADRLIAVSDFERDDFRRRLRLPDDRLVTLTNGVDQAFTDVERRVATATISSIGRLEEYKGHQDAIAALPAVRERVPEATLQIVGTGPYEPELRDLVARLSLEDAVTFTSVPAADRSAMARLMADSRVVVVPSRYESQGLVGYEAIASGSCLVTFAGSALAELDSFDSVDVVARHDSDAFVEAIVGRLRSPRPERRADLLGWDDVVQRLEGIYTDVVRQRTH